MEIVRQKKSKKSNNTDADDNAPADFDRPEDESKAQDMNIGALEILPDVKSSKGMEKNISQILIDDIDLTIEPERPPSFYYYKRWIWMIFPWVCMSVNKKQTFSDLISKCYSSNIRYLSVEEEG